MYKKRSKIKEIKGDIMKSILFVLKENIANLYRIKSITKYELKSDVRDTKLGFLWNILSPSIQIFTFWIVFGIGIRSGQDVKGVAFLPWMIVGMMVWFFVSPCITQGVGCIYSKRNIITKMKFPVSILPTTVVAKELINHLFMVGIVVVLLLVLGFKPSIYWLGCIYDMFCAFCFCIALNTITSVLNMFTRDVSKLVKALMRMLLYLTPILWTLEKIEKSHALLATLLKLNPLFYIVEGYRESFFYQTTFMNHPTLTIYFWVVTIAMYCLGSWLMYKFKSRFIDMM